MNSLCFLNASLYRCSMLFTTYFVVSLLLLQLKSSVYKFDLLLSLSACLATWLCSSAPRNLLYADNLCRPIVTRAPADRKQASAYRVRLCSNITLQSSPPICPISYQFQNKLVQAKNHNTCSGQKPQLGMRYASYNIFICRFRSDWYYRPLRIKHVYIEYSI